MSDFTLSSAGTSRSGRHASFLSIFRNTGQDLATTDHSMDHSTMDHSDMSGMMSPTAGPSTSHRSHDMVMSMQMWFSSTEHVILWFREWNVTSRGTYVASVIGLIALCILQEAISSLRTSIARSNSIKRSAIDAENAAVVHPETAFPPIFGRMRGSPMIRLVLSLLYAFNLLTSYLLMLAVMTYNVGYFVAIVLGLAFGHFIFFPAAAKADLPRSTAAC